MSEVAVSAARYVVNVEGVVVRDGRYLLAVRGEAETHAPGTLSPPGGEGRGCCGGGRMWWRLCAARSARKPASRSRDEIIYLGSSIRRLTRLSAVNIVFLCRYRSGIATPADVAEVAEVAWLTAAEAHLARLSCHR